MTPPLTVISGPSGVGKGTVVATARRRHPQLWVSVSATTRAPRPGETDGVQYHFVDRSEFDRMAAAGELLEQAEFAGNCYGTPRAPVTAKLREGVPVLLEIDMQGARQVRRVRPDALLVFLAPPSHDELHRRLLDRGTETDVAVVRRIAAAHSELAAQAEFDAVIVNDDVERAADELVALMANPTRRRARRPADPTAHRTDREEG
ncbi:MAG: guanylate kinase [Mycobacteriales bacterium]